MHRSVFWILIVSIPVISRSQTPTEDTVPWPNGDEEIIPSCNNTCKYTAWAFDANCRQRNLQTVPQECREAKMLDLRDNRITRIVGNVFESFRNLLYVDLEDNGITDLDVSAFVGNDRVRHIYLQSNNLETIRSGTFTGVPNLLQLYLNSNRIRLIDGQAFTGLSKLETLFLSENELDDIPKGLLSGLDRLRYFHMTHNQLTILRNNTFKDLSTLRHLNFINNNIRTIEAGAFKGLISLRVLRLAYNEISVIGLRAFSPMRGLVQLDLYSNRIESISNHSHSIRRIEELYLGDNPLKCDCKIEPLRLWYQSHNITDSKAKATCSGPASLKGAAVATIDVEPCPPPVPKSVDGDKEKNDFAPEARRDPEKGQQTAQKTYYNQYQNSAQANTILVIVIACVVLFAVCFVGFICFIYHAYFRKPFDHKQYYKQISRTDSDTSDGSKKDLNVHVTVNPVGENNI